MVFARPNGLALHRAPEESLHVLDFAGHGATPDGLLARLLHSTEQMRGNVGGRISVMLGEAGLAQVDEVGHRSTLLGRVAHYAATAPQP